MSEKQGVRVRVNDRMTRSFQKSVSAAVKVNQDKGHPIAKYDSVKRAAFLEYSDGSVRYVR